MPAFFTRPKNFTDWLVLFIKIGLILVLFSPLVAPALADQYKGFSYYFPFIVPRNLYWRLIIDVIFGLYLFLYIRRPDYRPKFNAGLILFLLFIISLTISSLLGGNFSFSFWSNFERMDGLVNWYHIFAYVLVLVAMLGQDKRQWNFLWQCSLVVADVVALHALGQALKISWLMPSSGDTRLTATLGNAAYVGSYLFLHLVVLGYLWLQNIRQKKIWSVSSYWYAISGILFFYVLVATQTRAPFLALLFFILLLSLFYLWFSRRQRDKKYYLVAVIILAVVAFIGLLFAAKDSQWVKSVPLWQKITSISLRDTTTASRLYIWQESLKAFREKPIFGWGEENFLYAFNKYFPPQIYRGAGSETWFDRPHNILVQHLVQGGILALGLYLAFFFYLIVNLHKRYKKEGDWFANYFWIAFILSFLLQDFFIFDNLSVNVIVYLILAYLFSQTAYNESLWQRWQYRIEGYFGGVKDSLSRDRMTMAISLGLITFLFIGVIYRPGLSNRLLIESLRKSQLATTSADFDAAKLDWEKSTALSALGDKEKVEVLLQIFQNVLQNPYASNQNKRDFFVMTGQNFEAMANKYPFDIRFNIILSSFYQGLSKVEPTFLLKNIQLLERLESYAPNRPDIKLQLTRAYLQNKDLEKAKMSALGAKDLAPATKEVNWNLVDFYWQAGDYQQFGETLEAIKGLNQKISQIDFEPVELNQLEYYLSEAEQLEYENFVNILKKYLP